MCVPFNRLDCDLGLFLIPIITISASKITMLGASQDFQTHPRFILFAIYIMKIIFESLNIIYPIMPQNIIITSTREPKQSGG